MTNSQNPQESENILSTAIATQEGAMAVDGAGLPANVFDALSIPLRGTHIIEASAGTGKTYGIASLFARFIIVERMGVDRIAIVTFSEAAANELRNRLRDRLQKFVDLMNAMPMALGVEDLSQTPDDGLDDGEIDELFKTSEVLKDFAKDSFFPSLLKLIGKRAKSGDYFKAGAWKNADEEDGSSEGLDGDALASSGKRNAYSEAKLLSVVALSNFDQAAIATLHGFFLKALKEEAFLCNTPFEVEIAPDRYLDTQMAIKDFWRTKVAANEELTRFLDSKGFGIKKLEDFIDESNNIATIKHVGFNSDGVEELFKKIEDELRTLLLEKRDSLAGEFDAISDRVFTKRCNYESMFEFIHGYPLPSDTKDNTEGDVDVAPVKMQTPMADHFLEGSIGLAEVLNFFDNYKPLLRYASGNVVWIKKHVMDVDAYKAKFPTIQKLAELVVTGLLATKMRIRNVQYGAMRSIVNEIEKIKAETRTRTFDDILLDLRNALLNPERGKRLANQMASKYDSLLVDEFQDTDGIQYEIIKRVFIDSMKPVYLIGDPKQSIYSFRGADIFAYINAVKEIPDSNRHSMVHNHRSHKDVIEVVNRLFSKMKRPFLIDAIRFRDSLPPEGSTYEEFDREEFPAFTFNFLKPSKKDSNKKQSNNDGSSDNAVANTSGNKDNDASEDNWAAAVAADIATTLNRGAKGELKIDGKGVKPKDVCVLVRSNIDAEKMSNALKEVGVNSVFKHRRDIFDTEEAKVLYSIMSWILNPKDVPTLMFILASKLFGHKEKDLAKLMNSPQGISDWIEKADRTRRIWKTRNFNLAMREFLSSNGVEKRLVRLGEFRTITNINHLVDLVSSKDNENLTQEALVEWMRNILRNKDKENENELKLENDELLVQIITIHRSKGLQYPIVYMPHNQFNNTKSSYDKCSIFQKEPTFSEFSDKEKEELQEKPSMAGVDGHEEKVDIGQKVRKLEENIIEYINSTLPMDNKDLDSIAKIIKNKFDNIRFHRNGHWLLKPKENTSPDEIDESRLEEFSDLVRLCYVAFTRAKHQVNIYMVDNKLERSTVDLKGIDPHGIHAHMDEVDWNSPLLHLSMLNSKGDKNHDVNSWLAEDPFARFFLAGFDFPFEEAQKANEGEELALSSFFKAWKRTMETEHPQTAKAIQVRNLDLIEEVKYEGELEDASNYITELPSPEFHFSYERRVASFSGITKSNSDTTQLRSMDEISPIDEDEAKEDGEAALEKAEESRSTLAESQKINKLASENEERLLEEIKANLKKKTSSQDEELREEGSTTAMWEGFADKLEKELAQYNAKDKQRQKDGGKFLATEVPLANFEKGMNAGFCLHSSFEVFNFNEPAELQKSIPKAQIETYGFDMANLGNVIKMMDVVRNAELLMDGKTCLKNIPATRRKPEMEFLMFQDEFSKHKLDPFMRGIFKNHPEIISSWERMDFAKMKTFLKGFIDMLAFDENGDAHVIDYKTNYLGPNYEDYVNECIWRNVAHSHYYFQALIYSIAAYRYLRNRRMEPKHIYTRYFYLRGMNDGGTEGIWYWEYPLELIKELDETVFPVAS